jgi:hypothetical protein
VATDTEADSDETETEGEVEDDVEVPVDIVLEWMASDGKKIPPGYEVGPDGALRVSSNESEEYECREEAADTEDGIQAAEYGRGKRRKTNNQQYSDFWRH